MEKESSRKSIDIDHIFKENGISVTPVRILVYKTLYNSQIPLSLSDLETILETVDKSSISRTLNLFRNKKLVHFFDDGSGSVKYEICSDPDHKGDDDSHVHFHCSICGKTICFHSIKIPSVDLPEGFIVKSSNYIIKGICRDCANKSNKDPD